MKNEDVEVQTTQQKLEKHLAQVRTCKLDLLKGKRTLKGKSKDAQHMFQVVSKQ